MLPHKLTSLNQCSESGSAPEVTINSSPLPMDVVSLLQDPSGNLINNDVYPMDEDGNPLLKVNRMKRTKKTDCVRTKKRAVTQNSKKGCEALNYSGSNSILLNNSHRDNFNFEKGKIIANPGSSTSNEFRIVIGNCRPTEGILKVPSHVNCKPTNSADITRDVGATIPTIVNIDQSTHSNVNFGLTKRVVQSNFNCRPSETKHIHYDVNSRPAHTTTTQSDVNCRPIQTQKIQSDVNYGPSTTTSGKSDPTNCRPTKAIEIHSDVNCGPTTIKNVCCNINSVPTTTRNVHCDVNGVPTTTENFHCDVNGVPTITKNVHCDFSGVPTTTKNINSNINCSSTISTGILHDLLRSTKSVTNLNTNRLNCIKMHSDVTSNAKVLDLHDYVKQCFKDRKSTKPHLIHLNLNKRKNSSDQYFNSNNAKMTCMNQNKSATPTENPKVSVPSNNKMESTSVKKNTGLQIFLLEEKYLSLLVEKPNTNAKSTSKSQSDGKEVQFQQKLSNLMSLKAKIDNLKSATSAKKSSSGVELNNQSKTNEANTPDVIFLKELKMTANQKLNDAKKVSDEKQGQNLSPLLAKKLINLKNSVSAMPTTDSNEDLVILKEHIKSKKGAEKQEGNLKITDALSRKEQLFSAWLSTVYSRENLNKSEMPKPDSKKLNKLKEYYKKVIQLERVFDDSSTNVIKEKPNLSSAQLNLQKKASNILEKKQKRFNKDLEVGMVSEQIERPSPMHSRQVKPSSVLDDKRQQCSKDNHGLILESAAPTIHRNIQEKNIKEVEDLASRIHLEIYSVLKESERGILFNAQVSNLLLEQQMQYPNAIIASHICKLKQMNNLVKNMASSLQFKIGKFLKDLQRRVLNNDLAAKIHLRALGILKEKNKQCLGKGQDSNVTDKKQISFAQVAPKLYLRLLDIIEKQLKESLNPDEVPIAKVQSPSMLINSKIDPCTMPIPSRNIIDTVNCPLSKKPNFVTPTAERKNDHVMNNESSTNKNKETEINSPNSDLKVCDTSNKCKIVNLNLPFKKSKVDSLQHKNVVIRKEGPKELPFTISSTNFQASPENSPQTPEKHLDSQTFAILKCLTSDKIFNKNSKVSTSISTNTDTSSTNSLLKTSDIEQQKRLAFQLQKFPQQILSLSGKTCVEDGGLSNAKENLERQLEPNKIKKTTKANCDVPLTKEQVKRKQSSVINQVVKKLKVSESCKVNEPVNGNNLNVHRDLDNSIVSDDQPNASVDCRPVPNQKDVTKTKDLGNSAETELLPPNDISEELPSFIIKNNSKAQLKCLRNRISNIKNALELLSKSQQEVFRDTNLENTPLITTTNQENNPIATSHLKNATQATSSFENVQEIATINPEDIKIATLSHDNPTKAATSQKKYQKISSKKCCKKRFQKIIKDFKLQNGPNRNSTTNFVSATQASLSSENTKNAATTPAAVKSANQTATSSFGKATLATRSYKNVFPFTTENIKNTNHIAASCIITTPVSTSQGNIQKITTANHESANQTATSSFGKATLATTSNKNVLPLTTANPKNANHIATPSIKTTTPVSASQGNIQKNTMPNLKSANQIATTFSNKVPLKPASAHRVAAKSKELRVVLSKLLTKNLTVNLHKLPEHIVDKHMKDQPIMLSTVMPTVQTKRKACKTGRIHKRKCKAPTTEHVNCQEVTPPHQFPLIHKELRVVLHRLPILPENPKLVLFKLSNDIYEKYQKGKPIMVSNILPTISKVETLSAKDSLNLFEAVVKTESLEC